MVAAMVAEMDFDEVVLKVVKTDTSLADETVYSMVVEKVVKTDTWWVVQWVAW